MTTLLERLERCERSLARLRFAVLGGLVAASALFSAGAATDAAPEIRAHAVTIVDDAGRAVVTLRGDATGGHVQLTTPGGLPAAELLVTGAGGRAVLYDVRGRVAVVSGCDANGGTLAVANRGASLVVRARADDRGNGTLTAWDGRENARVLTPTGVKRPARKPEAEGEE